MIKHFLTVSILACSIITQAQFSYTELPSNAKDSEYNFKKIAHLDAPPALSQGNTGT